MNEPKDFFGIKWGTKYEEFDKPENLIVFEESPQYKLLKIERKVDDISRNIGDFEIDSILYYFFDNRFYGVEIISRGRSNSQSLLNYLLSTLGDDYNYQAYDKIFYTWESENIEITAGYSSKTNDMIVTYFFKPIYEEENKYWNSSDFIKKQREVLPIEDKKCFIATVVYGSDSIEINKLRQWRDNWLTKYKIGRIFVKYYYKTGPIIAYYISKSKFSQKIVKAILYILIKATFNNRRYS